MLFHAILVGAALQLSGTAPQGATATARAVPIMGMAERDRLVMLLSDQRVDLRRAAAGALALQSDIGPAIPALYAALLDSDRAVRRSACEAIRKFRGGAEDVLRVPCL